MAHLKKIPIMGLLMLLICLMSSQVSGLAVMSVDLGSEWMKIAIVSVRN